MARRIRGQLLDALLESLEEPALGLDRRGVVKFIGAAFRELYPDLKEEVIIWDDQPVDPLIRWLSDCLDSTEPSLREQVVTHIPDRLWMARLEPVWQSRGRCSGWLLRLNDIEPVQKLSYRVQALLQQVRQEIREPLIGLKSGLEVLLEDGLEDRETALTLLAHLNEETNRLARLLLSLEPQAAGTPPGASSAADSGYANFDIAEVLERVRETYEPLARGKNLALAVAASGPLPELGSLPQEEFHRVLTNLVDNAVKFTSLDGFGEISVRVGPERRAVPGVLVAVDDTGPGVPESEREAVFEQFYRVTSGPTSRLGGTGLGLWRVKEAVAACGGEVLLEDSPLGGAGVRVWVPVEAGPRES